MVFSNHTGDGLVLITRQSVESTVWVVTGGIEDWSRSWSEQCASNVQ